MSCLSKIEMSQSRLFGSIRKLRRERGFITASMRELERIKIIAAVAEHRLTYWPPRGLRCDNGKTVDWYGATEPA
jgi:hypothetical protein